MNHNLMRYATILALTTAVISGTSNFINKIAVTAVKDPIAYTTLKNILVALVILSFIVLQRRWKEITALKKRQLFQLIAIGVIGGSVPFALFFSGLVRTSALNAGLIHKTLFLWVLLLAIPILKEKLTLLQWLGIGSIFVTNLFVGGFTGFKYNIGELMILGATILWAIENIVAKIALRDLSSLTIAAARMGIGSLVLLTIIIFQGKTELIIGLNYQQWSWTLLTSVLLLGYVATWYTALKYAPATYIAALLVPATLVTNILSAIFITHKFTTPQIWSTFFYIVGALVIIIFAKKTTDAFSPDLKPQNSKLSS